MLVRREAGKKLRTTGDCMAELEIHEATVKDAGLLADLELESESLTHQYFHPTREGEKARHEERLKRGEKYFVAYWGEKPVGYCSIREAFTRHSLELHYLSVHKDYHRRGVGKALVEKCEQEVPVREREKLYILVHQDNAPALSFFNAMGFSPVGVISRYYSWGDAAVVFCKEIKDSKNKGKK